MGMAASQARFLGLTARLNNVEFEGQQINQQRTMLSNKSASYYSDLLGMAVPTAPSVDAYTKTVYTFNDGALTNTITSMIATGGGYYTVSYLKTWQDDNAIVSAAPSIISTDGTDYFIGAQQLRDLGTPPTPGVDPYFDSLTSAQQTALINQESAYLTLLQNTLGLTPADPFYVRYVQNTTTGEYEPIFYQQTVVDGASYDSNGHSTSYIPAYEIGTKDVIEEIIGQVECKLEQDSTGRYINLTIPQFAIFNPVTYPPPWQDDGNGYAYNPVTGLHDHIRNDTYALSVNTVTDEDAYADAMNQYEYDKAEYDQAIAEINAKIEIVQAEDKNLELRLKQLDTEHNAIQTEKENMKDMIKKNIDSSFKSFSA